MELRTLRAFAEVARCGSFTLAAERLFVTQPTVSKLVRQLEDELGQQLFVREGKRPRLTDAGSVVLVHAERMLADAGQLHAELAGLSGLARGELRIGVPSLGGRVFVALISEFKRHYPGVELKLFEDGAIAIEAALLAGELELGGLLHPVDDPRYQTLTLVRDRLALIAPERSAWAHRPRIALAELADEPFILFTPGFALNDRIVSACGEAGFAPQVTGRSGQPGLIQAMVRGGIGVALLPTSEIAASARDGLAVCELEAEIPWEIALAWPRDAYLSHAARAWLALAQARYG
ncbi:LysR family transcriptional regulator [Jeongeupia sp. USM3]|uniref:LysR family transcriptional regulator n=1 Tax=Jeongeupia sp. USM3 TaxID=1906741 RepID=UPI00089DEFC5|nr:LysR family transcriptional regulator [Jeongeupia sp. USM3]AOY00705.1 LysR family transcriptional regulator [Jeongeupia sp. USM3]